MQKRPAETTTGQNDGAGVAVPERRRGTESKGVVMSEEHFYDHFTQDEPTPFGSRVTAAFSKRVLRFAGIRRGQSVLEIGPGRGVFADICLAEGAEYSAVEANQKMAERLEEKAVDVIRAKVPPLPALEQQFDAVVMINVMEHMNGLEEALETARQIVDVLKPAGKLVVCSPDYLNLRHNFFNCDFSHNYVTTRRRLEQLLVSAGLTGIRSRFLSGPLGGVPGVLASALIGRLPFASLNAYFPRNRLIRKLYKGQLAFSRKVLIVGEKES